MSQRTKRNATAVGKASKAAVRLQRFGCPAPPSAACELMPQAEGVSREV